MGRRRPHAIQIPAALLQEQLHAFQRKFGRPPGPNDPIFFDPAADHPTPLTVETLNAELRRAGREAGVDLSAIPDEELFDTVVNGLIGSFGKG